MERPDLRISKNISKEQMDHIDRIYEEFYFTIKDYAINHELSELDLLNCVSNFFCHMIFARYGIPPETAPELLEHIQAFIHTKQDIQAAVKDMIPKLEVDHD